MTEQQYRDTLSGFINALGQPCCSCKEFNYDQAEALLHIFVKLGWKQKQNGRVKKYEEFASRSGKFCSPAQMRKIEALWMSNAREKNTDALNHFIKRITGVDHITFLSSRNAHKIIKAIESL